MKMASNFMEFHMRGSKVKTYNPERGTLNGEP